ncbi:polysaccharide lyase family 7 protein [Microvirga terrestris]|uniref:Polysaccharide lyase family 7 protein n=1 Tax=Microvirga terrestris TaxID=2791024 RepID=A0ABS0HQE9_9HYPH|nr:polysaccharide lyase family 7 protein [Microvirga terrestris]MBF9195693.1 polysaccharide lyase family 7 protein [Microvirga terrestris]
MTLNPSVAPGGNFDLSNWKITLPVDANGGISGTAVEVKNLSTYQNSKYFYTAADGAMTFMAPVEGATTSGSSYARSELREMNGTANAAWNLQTGGFMSATLEVDAAPNREGMGGRVIVGQIHGKNDELVRLYWENGKLYFANDQAGSSNSETKFYFVNASGQQPSVSLDERFSYTINAKGDTLEVTVFADGEIYKSVSKINSVWQSDSFYFKAGAYLGANETNGTGYGQTSFYALSFNHNGTVTTPTQPTQPAPLPTPNPDSKDNAVMASDDRYAAVEDQALTVSASQGVLVNDAAPDGGKVAISGTFATAQGGSVKISADGSFVYTPKANFYGSDSFSYTAKDADGDTDTGAVTLAVADVAETGSPSSPMPTTSRPSTTKTMSGTSSADRLTGTSGNDLIDGKAGDDMIWAKNGSDVLTGGTGKDTFTFDTSPSSKNVDVIVDFDVVDDTIRLNDSAFSKLKWGNLSASSFMVGTKALDSDDRIIYDNKTGSLSYDADGSGSGAAVKFAVIENLAKLTAADFLVI